MEETFIYDDLNRLTGIAFDATKVHAMTLAQTTDGVFPPVAQTVTYTGFDKVRSVKMGTDSLCYTYGCDRQRIRMEEFMLGTSLAKDYVGSCEFIAETDGNITTRKTNTYLAGPYGVFAVAVKRTGSENTYYVLKDNQGSWTIITNATGQVEQQLSYDAWGNLRNPNTWANYTAGDAFDGPMFDRGYTGHEHLTDLGLINMNGRVYDPAMSSFLSADRFVQDPMTAQGFNRYAYCLYNPLRYVDPSGWRPIGGFTGYTPNTASNFDPYMFYGGRRPLEPRDLGIRQFDTADPIITWMEENTLHSEGNGVKGGEPIIDPSNLTPSQQQKFEKAVSFFKDNSSLFEKVYICLLNSETVYIITIGKTYNNLPAQFLPENNNIVFRDEESLISFWSISEEMFHAYQLSENKSLYDPQKEFNYEFEAKVAVIFMANQLNFGNRDMTGTNFERMSTFLSPDGGDVVFPTAQSIQGRDFLNGYYEGARFFRDWNIFKDYGNENYKKATLQTPKSLFELFKP